MEHVRHPLLLVLHMDGEQSPILYHLESPVLQFKPEIGLENTNKNCAMASVGVSTAFTDFSKSDGTNVHFKSTSLR